MAAADDDAKRTSDWVGPVLEKGPAPKRCVAAIREENDGAMSSTAGSYLRVLVRLRCSVTRAAIEPSSAPSVCPTDLEMIMPSFKGRFEVSEDRGGRPAGATRHGAPDSRPSVRKVKTLLTPLSAFDHYSRRHRSAQAAQRIRGGHLGPALLPSRGFEVKHAALPWYREHQKRLAA